MYKSIIIKFTLFYLFLSISLLGLYYSNYMTSSEKYLKSKTSKHFLEYKAIYEQQKTIANLIFNTEINTNKIIDIYKDIELSDKKSMVEKRRKLFKILENKYQKLQSHNLRQLHFHLPNNKSFLRMHKPNKFGDDLSSVRQTVSYVNKNYKYIDGFEEGRIYNGFRFVYPLVYENRHLGSVEISFSPLALINTIKHTYNNNSHFLIKKDVVESKVSPEEKVNYIQSPHDDFYYEKTIHKEPISTSSQSKDFSNKIIKGEAFSIFLEEHNLIKTFIPISNPISKEVVAALCICEKDTLINENIKDLIMMSISTLIALALILYLFLIQRITNEKLKKTNQDLDRKIDLEIKRNRKKDISILKQSKMASIAEMLNHIAHQWRQPLNVISTSSSGLIIHKEMNSLSDETFYLLTNSIDKQASYLSKTIENFREFLSDNEEDKKKVLIQKKLDETINIIQASFEYEKIQIIKNFEKDELYVNVNVGDLIQVILNILNNAKDALTINNSINDKLITIEIKKRQDKVIISVEDNGGGIPKEYKEKIFDPYFTTKHESIGTGISLYLCYEIITNQEKGKIYFKNKSNGSKFYIELPLENYN